MGRKSKVSEADIIGAIREIEGGAAQTERPVGTRYAPTATSEPGRSPR